MTSYVDPAKQGVAVSPSDTNFIVSPDFFMRGVYVGSTGNLSVVMANGTVVFSNVPAGAVLPLRISRVNATGTTASNIVGLY